MDPASARVASVERAICDYLQAHPHAVDTERGICEWWLRGSPMHPLMGEVQLAVQRLASTGRLVSLALPDGQVAYTRGRGDRPPGLH